jgi:hypothetical protein
MNSCQSRRQAHNARNQCDGYKPNGGRVSCTTSTTTTTTEPGQKTKWIYYNSFLLEALLQLSCRNSPDDTELEKMSNNSSKKASERARRRASLGIISFLLTNITTSPAR